jgi:hypothetical protein
LIENSIKIRETQNGTSRIIGVPRLKELGRFVRDTDNEEIK